MNQQGSSENQRPDDVAKDHEPLEERRQGAPPEDQEAGSAEDHGVKGTTSVADAAKSSPTREEVDELTSAQHLRKSASEARDLAAVLQQFASSLQPAMGVARDVRVEGDFVMQMEQRPSAVREKPLTRSDRATGVDEDEIRRVRYVYQPPVAYSRCFDRLARRHLLLLLGPAHAGKRATAIHLALDLAAEPTILEYGNQVNLDDPTHGWQKGTVYLVDGLLTDRVRALRRQTLQDIANDLAKAGSYLILCIGPDAQPHEDVEREFAIRIEPPPQSVAILLERHMAFHAGDAFGLAEIQAFLRQPELKTVVDQPLTPLTIERLSRRLLRVMQGEDDMATALKEVATDVQGEVETWFEEAGDDIDERAFRIALAAFNGARYIVVQEAAAELAESLKPPALPEADKAALPPPSRFARRASRRLERARAHLESAPEPGSELPGSRIEVVRLDDERFAPVLLRHVWCEFDLVRDELLAWLAHHAVVGAADIRARAAAAIGALAVHDLTTIRQRVLIPWVKQDDRLHRAAIGKALGVLIWSDEHAPTVLAMLKEWSAESADRIFRWASARAYADIGLRYPREAMEGWRRILVSAEREASLGLGDAWWLVLHDPLVMSVLDTMVNFFLAAVEWPERYRPVYEGALEELRIWCDRDREEKRERTGLAMGLSLFMVLLDVIVSDPTSRAEEDLGPPAILVLVSEDPSPSPYRETLAELWRRVLNWRPTEREALNSLRDWLRRVDYDRRLEARAVALLREIATGQGAVARDRERLEVYLDRWASDTHQPVVCAGSARSALRS